MKDKEFSPLNLIRDYHSMLLKSANTLMRIKKLMIKDDLMDIKWKCEVARLLVDVEVGMQKKVSNIRELRRNYNCVEF